jgi:hypothetical protein
VIETVNEGEALIEIALRFRIFRGDFAGVGAEIVTKRLGLGMESERGDAGCQRDEKAQADGIHAASLATARAARQDLRYS